MSTKEAIDQWARQAVALAVYECLLAAASELDTQAKDVRGEAWWAAPEDEAWAKWRRQRRLVEGPTKPG